MEILSYRDERRCKTIIKIEVDDDLKDIEEAKRLIAEDAREQLRKYWKIEQELGIPLEVLFKALKDGIWYDNKHCPSDYVTLNYKDKSLKIYFAFMGIPIFVEPKLKDYGKTWALSKEELE